MKYDLVEDIALGLTLFAMVAGAGAGIWRLIEWLHDAADRRQRHLDQEAERRDSAPRC